MSVGVDGSCTVKTATRGYVAMVLVWFRNHQSLSNQRLYSEHIIKWHSLQINHRPHQKLSYIINNIIAQQGSHAETFSKQALQYTVEISHGRSTGAATQQPLYYYYWQLLCSSQTAWQHKHTHQAQATQIKAPVKIQKKIQ